MPGAVGNYGNVLSMMAIPEEKQIIVESGIDLFELRLAGQRFYDSKMHGFWDVRAGTEVNPDSGNIVYGRKWYTGPEAYVAFVPNKNGICYAFCPDDAQWHNRVMLSGVIDGGGFAIERIHTKDGMVPGGKAVAIINIIKNYLHEWKVIDGDVVKFHSKTKQEAESFLAENLSSMPKANLMWDKTEEIKNLIRVYRGGWIMSPDFQNKHRVKIQSMINDFNAESRATPAEVAGSLLQTIKQMSDSERSELVNLLGLNQQMPNNDYTPAVPKENTGFNLDTANVELLRKVARDYKIDPTGMKKEDLQRAIKAKIGMISDDNAQDDEVIT